MNTHFAPDMIGPRSTNNQAEIWPESIQKTIFRRPGSILDSVNFIDEHMPSASEEKLIHANGAPLQNNADDEMLQDEPWEHMTNTLFGQWFLEGRQHFIQSTNADEYIQKCNYSDNL